MAVGQQIINKIAIKNEMQHITGWFYTQGILHWKVLKNL
jgi:hypothetical protein